MSMDQEKKNGIDLNVKYYYVNTLKTLCTIEFVKELQFEGYNYHE